MRKVGISTSQSVEYYFVTAFKSWIVGPGRQVFFDTCDHHLGTISPLLTPPGVDFGADRIEVVFVVDRD